MKRIWKILGLALAVFVTTGCGGALTGSAHPEVTLSAWTAYWDMERGLTEYRGLKKRLGSVVYFAASFDANDRLTVPPEVVAARESQRKKGGPKAFLSFVNDVTLKNGQTIEKDTVVLRRVLQSPESTDRHVAEMVALARAGGYDGIELDYERVFKDAPELREKFLDFTYRLSKAAIAENLALRIVLEPSAPFDAGFCRGPEYVVMLYNLYGTHSGPGPKADRVFIEKTLDKMNALPESRAVAFSTGGCRWEKQGLLGQTGKGKFIDQAEAEALRDKYRATAKRDADSAVLSFDYEAEGKAYTVWYADSETLNAWITVAANRGIKGVSLWRLGGNTGITDVK